MTDDALLAGLRKQRVLPVLRLGSGAAAVQAAYDVIAAGLTIVELTATTPDWESAVEAVRSRGDAVVGIGTVTDEGIAKRAVDCGAQFLVSPWGAPAVRAVARQSGLTFLEGAFSPGEVAAAAALGPVKLFPAHVGGPSMLRGLRQLLPHSVVVPTGGISLDEVPAWLTAGAHAVGVGNDLLAEDATLRLKALLAATREDTA